jgi:hypothetical protein
MGEKTLSYFKKHFRIIYYETIFYLAQKNLLINQKNSKNSLNVVIGSAHKVGSTWLFNLVKDAFKLTPGYVPRELDEGTGTIRLDHKFSGNFLSNLNGYHIFKSHSFPVLFRQSNIKIITVIRDPRDVVVSLAFYVANIPEAKGGWGNEYARLSEKEKIQTTLHRAEHIVEKLYKWFYADNVLKIKYEDLIANPEKQLIDIQNFLNIDYAPKDDIYASILNNSFFNKSCGRHPGEENKSSFFRKGISGDWKNYFDEETVSVFKTALNERWNKLLIDLGYELNTSWNL